MSEGGWLLLRELWTKPWWIYDPHRLSVWSFVYHTFNILEGLAWCLFAFLVLQRYLRFKKSSLEVIYALMFLMFGLSDFREAYVQSAPLVLAKGMILVLLLRLRHFVIHKCYSSQCWY